MEKRRLKNDSILMIRLPAEMKAKFLEKLHDLRSSPSLWIRGSIEEILNSSNKTRNHEK